MDELDLRQLRSFLAVTQERSITRAGAALNLTQQAVSKHVRQLERSLGVTLLVRTSRGVLLTAAGEQLAADAPALLHDVSRLAERARAAAGAESGTLRLVCCPATTALFAVAVVESLEAAVPGLQVTMTTAQSPREELELLDAGRADVSFMWLPLGEVGLHRAVVRRDRRAVALPPRHRLAGHATLTLADLADEPVVRPAVLTSAEAERFWLADPRPDGRPAPRGPVLPCVEDALLEVARGRGVWFAPQPLSAVIPLRDLPWIEVEDAEPFDLAVVWTDRAPQSLVGRLVAEVRSVLREGKRARVA